MPLVDADLAPPLYRAVVEHKREREKARIGKCRGKENEGNEGGEWSQSKADKDRF